MHLRTSYMGSINLIQCIIEQFLLYFLFLGWIGLGADTVFHLAARTVLWVDTALPCAAADVSRCHHGSNQAEHDKM